MRVCSVPGCNRKTHFSLEICVVHYKRQYRVERRSAGNPLARHISKHVCSELGCEKPVDARGLCAGHYGTLRYRQKIGKLCEIAACGKKAHTGELCANHARRLKLYGDPLHDPKPVQATHCSECGCERIVKRDRMGRHDLCRRCFRSLQWYANVIENRANANAWQKRARRQTPPWADVDAIREIYRNRPQGHEVDHIIPLKGRTVSGLHVETNLQYLPMLANRRKGVDYLQA